MSDLALAAGERAGAFDNHAGRWTRTQVAQLVTSAAQLRLGANAREHVVRAPQLSGCPLAISAHHEQLSEIATNARRVEYERDSVQLIGRRPQQLDGAREVAIAKPGDECFAGSRPRHPERVIHLRGIAAETLDVLLGAPEILHPQRGLENDRDQPVNGPRDVARTVGERDAGLA